jgi:hypothetical protein
MKTIANSVERTHHETVVSEAQRLKNQIIERVLPLFVAG